MKYVTARYFAVVMDRACVAGCRRLVSGNYGRHLWPQAVENKGRRGAGVATLTRRGALMCRDAWERALLYKGHDCP